MKNKTFAWFIGVVVWGGALVLALTVSHFSKLNFWVVFAIIAISLILSGIFAEIEDHAPGGFLNPKDKKNENRKL